MRLIGGPTVEPHSPGTMPHPRGDVKSLYLGVADVAPRRARGILLPRGSGGRLVGLAPRSLSGARRARVLIWSSPMAYKYERPFRVQPGMLAPVFQTQHQAHDFLAEYQARGAIRRCAHARVRGTGSGGWTEGYAVYCEKDSFELVQIVPATGLGIGDRSRGFSGCPAGCRLYRPRWRATLSRWRDSIRHALWWLDRQSWHSGC
jgi:hypothetical protein